MYARRSSQVHPCIHSHSLITSLAPLNSSANSSAKFSESHTRARARIIQFTPQNTLIPSLSSSNLLIIKKNSFRFPYTLLALFLHFFYTSLALFLITPPLSQSPLSIY